MPPIPRSRAFCSFAARLCASVAIVLVLTGVAAACPTCKDGISDPQAANIARGYFWSILFMMSMPFVILCSLGTYFYWEVCRARRLRAEAGAAVNTTPALSPDAAS